MESLGCLDCNWRVLLRSCDSDSRCLCLVTSQAPDVGVVLQTQKTDPACMTEFAVLVENFEQTLAFEDCLASVSSGDVVFDGQSPKNFCYEASCKTVVSSLRHC